MARIFITGSADGLGQLSAKALITQGHQVLLHARNTARARDAIKQNPGAEGVVTGDLSDTEETKNLAREVNAWGAFDAIIHNAGSYRASARELFAVNTLAPYILTCLIEKPKRLIYLSSGMHESGSPKLESFSENVSRLTYSDTKLHVLMLCLAAARKWKDVYANTVNPGWVPTKMGGRGAPDDLQKGYETQVWLAASEDAAARVSGKYFFHKKEEPFNPLAADHALQEEFLTRCGNLTNIRFPR